MLTWVCSRLTLSVVSRSSCSATRRPRSVCSTTERSSSTSAASRLLLRSVSATCSSSSWLLWTDESSSMCSSWGVRGQEKWSNSHRIYGDIPGHACHMQKLPLQKYDCKAYHPLHCNVWINYCINSMASHLKAVLICWSEEMPKTNWTSQFKFIHIMCLTFSHTTAHTSLFLPPNCHLCCCSPASVSPWSGFEGGEPLSGTQQPVG